MSDLKIPHLTISLDKKGNSLFTYFYLFSIIYLSSSYYIGAVRGTISLALVALLSILAIILNAKNIWISRGSFIILNIAIANSIITSAIQKESYFDSTIMLAAILAAYVVTITIKYKHFLRVYCDIIYFLSVFSLIVFGIALILPKMIQIFPVIENILGVPAYNLFFSVVRLNDYMLRNDGLFWEAGAFQTYINIALFIELFLLKKGRVRYVLAFMLAIFTTFSPTGYVVCGVLCGIYIFRQQLDGQRRERGNNKNRAVKAIILVGILVLMTYTSLPFQYQFQLYGKIEGYLAGEKGNYDSTSVRVDAIRYPLQAYLTSPIFGIGYEKMNELAIANKYLVSTCTPVNWLAVYGIAIGSLFIISFFKLTKWTGLPVPFRIAIFIILLAALSSEDYSRNASILVFVFYGWQSMRPKKCSNIEAQTHGQVIEQNEMK